MLTDIQTCFAPVASTLEGATARGVLWQAARGRFLLDIPDVARYLVSDGAVITIDRAPDVRDEEMMRFLRMTPLAALFFQRGSLAFHAAAASPPSPLRGQVKRRACSSPLARGLYPRVNVAEGDLLAKPGALTRDVNTRLSTAEADPQTKPGAPTAAPAAVDGEGKTSAILIAGDSGAGKSTLLTALLQRGWRLLADDLAVVDVDADGQLDIPPAFPEIVLWPDALEKLGLSAATIKAFPNSWGPSVLTSQLAATPQPLRAIYWLSVHHKDEIEMIELKGAERFRAIGTLTYNSHIADALLDRAAYLRLASTIAQTIPLYRLRRPRGQWSVEEMADKIIMASETLRFGQSDQSSP
ncbi:hypothetical protein D4R89_13920 [bacterium]|nr:MAG: hypothetical protein D4R89_13920 [bacterium]